jgi:hypothetical protein
MTRDLIRQFVQCRYELLQVPAANMNLPVKNFHNPSLLKIILLKKNIEIQFHNQNQYQR